VTVVVGNVTAVKASPTDTTTVVDFLRTYEATLATGRVDDITSLYADFDSARRAELQRHFDEVISNLVVRLDDVRIAVEGTRAEVAFRRTDAFTDRESGRHVEKGVSLTRQLSRDGSGWRLILDGK
jgi:hypothetical protein